jgi:hypothetical protein
MAGYNIMITLEEFPGLTIVPDLCYGEISLRSKLWNKTRIAFIKKNPFCAYCKSITYLQVHHIKPFHIWPELELNPENLVVLCENPNINCHFKIGHLEDWKSYNPLVLKQIYFRNNKPYDKNDTIWG